MADDNSTFNVSANGGCFILSGVDWDMYQNPVIKITSGGVSGSCWCKLATQCSNENPYWPNIETADLYNKSWSFGSDITIDLSGKGISGKQNLYFSLNGDDFEGNISIKIMEK